MPTNDAQVNIKLPAYMKEALDTKFPDVYERNQVIRALIRKLLDGGIVLKSYELEVRS